VQALDESGRSMFAVSFAGAEVDHLPGERTFAFAIPLPASGARAATLRLLSGMQEVARRSRPLSPTAGGASTNRVTSPSRLVSLGWQRSRLEWDAKTYPGAMVRDAATGQVLAFLAGGSGEVDASREIEVLLSTGVTSMKQRFRVSAR
jgi:hypothetical protein